MEQDNSSNFIREKLEELKFCDEILEESPSTKDVLLKQCQIFLTLRLFKKALLTSESILEKDTHCDLRTICYKTKALIGLGRYQDALSFLIKYIRTLKTSTVTTNPNYIHRDRHLRILDNHLKDVKKLLDQQTNGTYDMTLFVPNRKIKYDNVSEFKGPIEIGTTIPGKGRGMIATRDIEPGQLLLASRAFEILFDDDDNWNLEMAIAQRLALDPEFAKEVYQLHAGNDLGFLKVRDKVSEIVDMDRITGICTMNSFGNSLNSSGYGHNSRGLWIFPSFMNHDCIDFNCIWKCLGDFIFVRSTKAIKTGEEILIAYTDSSEPLQERVKFFQAHQFLCQCRLCQFEMKQEVENPQGTARKNEIFNYVEELSKLPTTCEQNNSELIQTLESNLKELEEMGIKSGKPEWNFSRHAVLDILCKFYSLTGDFDKLKETSEAYYQVVNGTGVCLEVGAGGQVATNFLKSGDISGASKWIKILKKDLTLVYGDSNVFKLIYPILHRQAINSGIKC